MSVFDIRFIKYLFVYMYHTHMHVCVHPCSLCCHFTITFYVKTVKVLWIISDGSEYPLRLRVSQSFWKPKSSHFNSFENPWRLALNFNQEKLYLINNGICWLDEGLDQYWFWQLVLAGFAWRNMLVVVLKSYVSSSTCASFSWSIAWKLVSKVTSRS